MKKILALILALALILTPILCLAARGGAASPRILSASYDGDLLSGETTAQGSAYWARCTIFLTGGTYFVLSVPIYADGTFGIYIALVDVLGIGVEIRDQPGTHPDGTVHDFAVATL